MTNRRFLLSAALAALTAPALAALPPKTRAVGDYPIKRNRFGLAADFTIQNAKVVTRIPMGRVVFTENGDATLLGNGMIQINTQGLYRIALSADWKAQEGLDIDRRMIGVRRKPAGYADASPLLSDERLGSIDTPASDAPRVGRFSGTWAPGSIPTGGSVSTEIGVEASFGGSPHMIIGDLASASLSSASDDLVITARVVSLDRVRVTARNFGPGPVSIGPGSLRVLTLSADERRGESNDAWQVLNCVTEELFPGDAIYACARVLVDGDYLQNTGTMFLQLERVA